VKQESVKVAGEEMEIDNRFEEHNMFNM